MSLNSTWRTHDPPELLTIEAVIFTGGFLGAIAYGAHIVVFLLTLHALWSGRNQKRALLSTFFICVLFISASLNIIRTEMNLKLAFVDYRNFPGGPGAFFPVAGSLLPASTRYGDAGAVIATWTADAILLWRCYVVWSKRLVVIAVPVLMWLGSVATGIIVSVQNNEPGKTLRTLGTADFNLAFWCLALSLNVLLSGLILGQLLRARANAAATLGSAHARTYTGISAIIIESAGLYAIFGLAWVIMYGMKSLGGFMLLQVLVQIEAIAPELIILRIARGHAWTATTSEELTSASGGPMRFATQTNGTSTNGSKTFQSSRDVLPMHGLKKSSTFDSKAEA